ncbi:MAG: hypothetical protein ABUT39_16130 [Acidobacteriota bacterium]
MRSYAFHGLTVGVSVPIEAVHARFASLPPSEEAPDLRFEVGNGFERPAGARTVYEPPAGEVVYHDAGDLLYLEHGPMRVLADPGDGRVLFSMGEIEGEELWILSHPFVSVPMMELLKRRGLFGVHAAGAALDGRALVLAGTSGSGKSTLSLALARAGFDFLGDDTLFLAWRPDGLRVLAFPDEIDLTEETAGFFPELPETAARATPGWRKRQLRAGEAFGARIAWECEPAVLVFPRVSGRPRSELRPIDAGEALLELAPNVLLTQPEASQAHLDALAELARASRCWRLETGTDLDEAATLLRGLLA